MAVIAPGERKKKEEEHSKNMSNLQGIELQEQFKKSGRQFKDGRNIYCNGGGTMKTYQARI